MITSFCHAKSIAKSFLILFLLVHLFNNKTVAQTYPSGCKLGLAIPDNSCGIAPLIYTIPVGGVAGTQMGADVMLSRVDLVIRHTSVADLEIYLQSPMGPAVELSVGNGFGGNNYGDPLDTTCFTFTSFVRSAMLSITAGIPPFIGPYRPQGDFSDFDDLSNPNGNWSLIICDAFSGDTGTLEYVSLQFAPPCEQPVIDLVLASSDEARVNFTSFNSGAIYTLEWGVPGFSPGGIGSLGTAVDISSAGTNSTVIMGLSPVTEYEIYISENCGDQLSAPDGPYYFVTTRQSDICSGAIPVVCGAFRIDSTTFGATDSDAPAACEGVTQNVAPGLWYVYKGNGADVTVSLCGVWTNYDTRLGVFEGPCADLTCIAANDDFCGSASEVTFTAETGKDYYIYVSGGGGEIGIFEISISCTARLVINEVDYAQPGTDDAEFIELLNSGSTTLNLNNFSVFLIDGTGGGASLYTPIDLPDFNLAAGNYFVICADSNNVSNCDMHLGVNDFLRNGSPDAIMLSLGSTQLDAVSYNGNTGTPYTEGSGNGLEDDSTSVGSGISRLPNGKDTDVNNVDFLQACVSPGVANISQSAACTVANDSCAHATVITPALGIPFDNRGATTDGGGDTLCSSNLGENDTIFSDIWYSFTAACNGIATVSTDSVTSYDSKIAVYQSSCGGTIIACNDDIIFAVNVQSSVSWPVVSGETYLIRLGGFDPLNQASGIFNLALVETEPPVINCGADKIRTADPGLCSATVNPLPATAVDNCSNVAITNNFTHTASALGSYPVGTTVITWTATDASGNTATCVQSVTVTDDEAPSIICPYDIIQTADAGSCGAFVSVPPPLAVDNCMIDSIQNDFNGTPDASGFYPVGVTSVLWVVEDESGLTSTCLQTITITDNQKPVAICPPDLTIPGCDSFGIVPAPSFDENCGVVTFINDYNSTPDASDFYNVGTTPVTWTVTDVSGNTGTCSMNVIRNSDLVVSFTGLAASYCLQDDPDTLFGIPPGGIFSGPGVNGNVFSPSSAATGTHNITYLFNDGNGCSGSLTLIASVLDAPAATATPDTGICPGADALLKATGGISYSWNTGTTLDAVLVNPVVTTDYIVSVTGNNGCTDVDTATVVVFPRASIDAGSNQTVCSGSSIMLTATGGIGYSWNTGDLSAYISVSPIVSTTYFVSATDGNGCSGSDSVTVDVLPAPLAVPGSDQNICRGDTVVISVSGGSSYLWSDGNTAASRPAAPSMTTSYMVTVSDANGCADTTSVTVTVRPQPFVTLLGLDGDYCNNDQPDTISGNPPGGFFGGPAIVGNVLVPTLLLPGIYTISYTFIDSFGCQASDSNDVTIYPAPLNTFIVGLQSEYCMDISAHQLIGFPPGGTFSGAGVSGNIFISYYAGPGSHDIIYTYDSGGICVGRDTQTVVVHPLPAVSISGLDSFYCSNSSAVSMTGVPAGGTFSGTGVFGNTFFPDMAVVEAPTVIYYEYFDSNGCAGRTQAITTVHANPIPVIINPGALCLNDGAIPLYSFPAGGVFSGPGVSNGFLETFVAGVGTHSIRYTVTDNMGCTGDTSLPIVVNGLPEVTLAELEPEYCVNAVVVTLTGTPAGGNYAGKGVVGNTFYPALAETGGPYPITYVYSDSNGCMASDTQYTAVVNAPFLVISGLDPAYCVNDAPVPIDVLPTGGTLLGAGVSNGMFDPGVAGIGTHIITYYYDNIAGCVELERTFVTVDACVGVNDPAADVKVFVFPNPTEGRFTLALKTVRGAAGVIALYDVAGKIMLQEKIFSEQPDFSIEFNLSGSARGVYYLKLSLADETVVRKVVLQ